MIGFIQDPFHLHQEKGGGGRQRAPPLLDDPGRRRESESQAEKPPEPEVTPVDDDAQDPGQQSGQESKAGGNDNDASSCSAAASACDRIDACKAALNKQRSACSGGKTLDECRGCTMATFELTSSDEGKKIMSCDCGTDQECSDERAKQTTCLAMG